MSNPSILSALKKLRSLLTREEKIKWLVIVGFALCSSLLELITASIIVVFAQVLNEPSIGQKYLINLGFITEFSPGRIVFYMSIAVGIIYLIKNLIAALELFFQNFSIQRMNYNFKNKLLNRYVNTDYGFYLTRNSSFAIQLIGSDVGLVFTNSMVSLATIISEATIFICLTCMIIYMNPPLAFIIFAVVLFLIVCVSKILLPKFYSLGQRLQESSLHSTKNLLQFFHAFKEVVLLGKQRLFIHAYTANVKETSRVQAIQTALNTMPRIGIECLFVGLFVLTIAYLCIGHESPAQIIGILGGYLYAAFRLMPGLNRIINQLNTFKSTIPSIEHVHKEYNSIAESKNYLDIPELCFNESIVLKDVSFKYLNTKKDVVSNINLEIKKGESIGIIGETGSGKSTLIDLILGLLKPHRGSILIDNKFPVYASQWHKKIGYVPQSIYLVDDTIEVNIAFGETNINKDALNKAIDAAQLRKFIETLPNGYSTIVGERGIRLSGGERQRIAIARALYRNPEVLIFDEATSALDNETESRLMHTINAISQDRTVIMIAHRLTTLKDCSRVIAMDGNSIKEIEKHQKIEVLNATI
jgi:ATP-binding cassette subfamily C protein